uniref:HMG domain-containing protein n=1 Tax=Knipowitschia caucasica TaxID=637954 RepID=A0AAV2M5B5_KNICA
MSMISTHRPAVGVGLWSNTFSWSFRGVRRRGIGQWAVGSGHRLYTMLYTHILCVIVFYTLLNPRSTQSTCLFVVEVLTTAADVPRSFRDLKSPSTEWGSPVIRISTYRKSCLNCGMIYRYQEWEEGIHNFDDHIILSLHLCLVVRNALQTHTAISKVIEIIEKTEKVSFPNKDRVLQAYLHFEALTNHDYTYSCVSCGYNPAVVVQQVRALCKQCGVDHKGSKVDLVIRLSEKMSNRVTYNKVFEKVWGASVKFNLRAESPRDFVDLLLSWKHFPNMSVYDYARGLALHANRRQPGIFDPFQGRLLDPTPENVKQASEGKVQLSQVLDETKSPTQHLAMVNGIILTRFDFWSLGLERDMDGMILNCCLKVIEKRVEKVFAADSHVISTWFPPLSLNHMDHLQDDAASLQWIILPVFVPGHWTLCTLFTPQGLTKQGCSNNCGVFVLMYTLYIVMGANCDFREENMLQIRRWWCLVLLQNFPMPSKETRLQERKRRRKQKGKQDLEVVPPKSIRLSESVSEASAKAESLPEVGTGNGEDSLLMDTLTAARWCGTRSFKGKLYLPQVITMNKEDSLRAVEMLRMCDGLDEEYKEDLSEPFMFMFSLQADYEEFCKEMMDKRQLQSRTGRDIYKVNLQNGVHL